MNNRLDSIDLHMIRVLHTLLTESSVSRAAVRLGMSQPAVSAALRRLRELSGDPLLVRSGAGMVPTARGADLVEPMARLLREAQKLSAGSTRFDPASTRRVFRIAAADYLDPAFLPMVVARLRRDAPGSSVEVLALHSGWDYRQAMASGEADIVLGNWLEPPTDLHRAPLFEDQIVCLVASDHPAATRGLDLEQYLRAEHVAPAPLRAAGEGVIDQYLHRRGLRRGIVVQSAFFNLIPEMITRSRLMLTTGRRYCEHYLRSGFAVSVVACPVDFPPLTYYLLWHARSHHDEAHRWLREQVRASLA